MWKLFHTFSGNSASCKLRGSRYWAAGVAPMVRLRLQPLHLEASAIRLAAAFVVLLKNVHQKKNMHREMVTANMG